MAPMSGSDVAQLRELADRVGDAAEQLLAGSRHISARLAAAPWIGVDSANFRSTWTGSHQPALVAAANSLRSCADDLRANAAEQERVSSSGGELTKGAVGTGSAPSQGGPVSDSQWTRGWRGDWLGANGDADAPRIERDARTGEYKINLGSAEGDVHIWRGEGWIKGRLGDADVDGKGYGEVGAGGSAAGELSRKGLAIDAAVWAGLRLGADGNLDWGRFHADGKASATAGAIAQAKAHLDKSGVDAHGEAFLGGKVGGTVNADVGGLGLGATGEAWYGFGVSGDFDFKFKDHKITLGGSGGAAWGGGGKVGASITVDPGKVAHTAGDLAHNIGGFLHGPQE